MQPGKMRGATVERQMPVSAAEVFTLLHDYSRRLEWDTLLVDARLTGGHKKAQKGATSICTGKPLFGLIGIETRYVSFRDGELAAVEMINRPPLFAAFSASIRHADNPDGSLITYKFRFAAKPRVLRWLLEPIMLHELRKETGKRLDALGAFLGRGLAGERPPDPGKITGAPRGAQ
jgi:hypothetical protein